MIDQLCSFSSLYEAYLACRKRKRNTINALQFEHDLLENLFALSETLGAGRYEPTRSVCFVTLQPKLREIFAADFRDRVVHHLLVPRLECIFEPEFIHDSFACRIDRGTHAAVRRLSSFMRSVTLGGRGPAWFLQLDIRSFFMNIDKEVLFGILKAHVKDAWVLELSRRIIMHDCTDNYIYKGDPGLLAHVPAHKSLFYVHEGKGLPIGNLTSQFFANVYLNEMDQYVKHTLKAKYYLRYMDDFILLDRSKDALIALKGSILKFLTDRLRLELKDDYALKRVSEGADFLGYIVRPDYVLARKRVVSNLKSRLDFFNKSIVRHVEIGKHRFVIHSLAPETVVDLRQTLASYLGHFKHANTHRLVRGLFEKHSYLNDLFRLKRQDNEYGLEPVIEPPTAPESLKGQYRWFENRYGGSCIFFQVGCYYEFYGGQALRYGGLLGLSSGPDKLGLGRQCGFPARFLSRYKSLCMRQGLSYVIIAEQGYYSAGLRRRMVTEIGRAVSKLQQSAAVESRVGIANQ